MSIVVVALLVILLAGLAPVFRLEGFSRDRVLFLVLCGYGLRILIALILPSIIVYDDEINYDTWGRAIEHSLRHGMDRPWEENWWGNVTGLLYYIFEPEPFVVKAVNAFLGVVTSLVIFRLLFSLTGSAPAARMAFLLCLFSPPTVLIGSIALKEQIVALGLSLFTYGFARSTRLVDPVMVAGGAMIWFFRFDLAILSYPVAALLILLRSSDWSVRSPERTFSLIALTLVGVLFFAWREQALVRLEESKLVQILTGEDRRGDAELAESEATYTQYLDITDPGALKNRLLVPIHSVFAPTPLRIITTPTPATYVEVLGMSLWVYLAMPFLVIAVFAARRHLAAWFMISIYAVTHLAAAYSILTAAPETFRYRWPGFPLIVAMASFAYYVPYHRRKLIHYCWWLAAIAFNVIYLRSFQG